jgi:ATP-dependent Clp protease ATP-binding subunit ClpA
LRAFFESNALPVGLAGGTPESGWLTEQAGWVLQGAIREAVVGGGGSLRLQHVLLSLLSEVDGVAERTIRQLDRDPTWLRGRLIDAIRSVDGTEPRTVTPTKAVVSMIEALWTDVSATGIRASEASVLLAAASQRNSETVRRLMRDLATTPAVFVDAVRAVSVAKRPETPGIPDTSPELQ